MAYCRHCGNKLEENATFCSVCGTRKEQTIKIKGSKNIVINSNPEPVAPVNPVEPEPIEPQIAEPVVKAPETSSHARASGTWNIFMLIWSVINLLVCCTPMGIAGLILTVQAKKEAYAQDEIKKIKHARICNLIGSVGYILYTIFFYFSGVLVDLIEYI